VNNRTADQFGYIRRGLAAAAVMCGFSAPLAAQDTDVSAAELIGDENSITIAEQFIPLPLLQNQSAGLAFDVAGSEKRKLQLQLAQPLNFELGSQASWINDGDNGGSIFAGGSLEWMATGNLSLGTSLEQTVSQVQFQPLGSIHCENGILAADSYRASDCYFIHDGNDLSVGTLSIGGRYDFGARSSAAFNLFQSEATLNAAGARIAGRPADAIVLEPGLLSPVMTNPVLPRFGAIDGLESLDSEVTGIDLEFKLGISTGRAGDMQLGLQFTHVLDASYEGMYSTGIGFDNWTVAEPFDSARVSFDWQKNSFSGGVQGFYREQVDFLNRSDLDAVTTFDVHFTWRAPWNASLSVGASNVLNSGIDDSAAGETKITDPFEAVYGRIPYVRYQQDL
jgi:hypothetical protein